MSIEILSDILLRMSSKEYVFNVFNYLAINIKQRCDIIFTVCILNILCMKVEKKSETYLFLPLKPCQAPLPCFASQRHLNPVRCLKHKPLISFSSPNWSGTYNYFTIFHRK